MKALLITVLLLIAALVAFTFFNRQEAVVQAAWTGSAIQAVPGSVVVKAEFEMNLRSELGGRVISSRLAPGVAFVTGDFLVQLDPAALELEIERVEGEIAAARRRLEVGSSIALELETARENLANSERLMRMGSFSATELEQQRRAVRQIEQRLELETVNNELSLTNLENQLANRRLELRKMSILSPIDGVVSQVLAQPGDLIGANTSIATMISLSRTVEARISEENFAGIRVGQRASVRLLGYGTAQFNATVATVLPAADPETQRYMVYLNVEIEPEKLVPGLTGEVSIITAQRDATVIVPRRALIGNRVMVIEGNVARLRTVERGYESFNEVEILQGVKHGDLVVIEELDRFRDGERVRGREIIR
jgi:RND family efflux transporter MFP subunit